MKKLVYGHGINDVKGESTTPAYVKWKNMLRRCYSPKCHTRHPTYIGCTVSDVWLTFSNFKAWFDKHNVVGFDLDKDLLIKDNKVYSKDTCLFVSSQINTLMTDSGATRGDYPIGVTLDKRCGKYQPQLTIKGKPKALGLYTNLTHSVQPSFRC